MPKSYNHNNLKNSEVDQFYNVQQLISQLKNFNFRRTKLKNKSNFQKTKKSKNK
jgi:hypothetical protein